MATIAATPRRAKSIARAGNRSISFSAERYRIDTLSPSTKPACCRPCWNPRRSPQLEQIVALDAFERERPDSLFVSIGALFTSRRVQLATLAARHMVPMTSANRQITEAGGLMSYGANITDAQRQLGVYAGRILKGEKPADLPVVQATKLELVINAETARMFGLTVPPSLLAIADEVIE